MTRDDTDHSDSRDVDDVEDVEDLEFDEVTIADFDADRGTDPKGGISGNCMSGAQME